MARKRRSFTPEYQAEVVGLIRGDGKARTAVARDLGLTDSAVRRRVERSEVDEGRGASHVGGRSSQTSYHRCVVRIVSCAWTTKY